MKNETKTIFIFLFFFHVCDGQQLLEVLQPDVNSRFEGGYKLPDGSARFFVSTDRGNFSSSETAYVIDWDQMTGIPALNPIKYDSLPYGIINSAYELLILPLPGGDCIVAANSFNCDIYPPSQIVNLQEEGQVKWDYNGQFDCPVLFLESIALVDTNVLAFISSEADTLYFTFSGEEMHYQPEPNFFHHPAFFGGHFFGERNGAWFRLDEQFDVIASHTASGVSFFTHMSGDSFLLCSNLGLELVNSSLNSLRINPSLGPVYSAAFIKDLIYVTTPDGLHVLDLQLNELHRYLAQPAEEIKFVYPWGDSVMVVSEYDGIAHDDIVLRTYRYMTNIAIGNIDIALDRVQMPDTVYVDYIDGVWYHKRFRFDTISWLVQNHGSDTIHSFTIKFNWLDWCSQEKDEWHIDTALAPGASVVIHEYGYFIETYSDYYSPYCFWVELPDGQPDHFPGNDQACGMSKIAVATRDISSISAIQVYPNPAQYQLSIDLGNTFFANAFARLYNVHGQQVLSQQLYQANETIDVSSLIPGIYCLQIMNQQKIVSALPFFIKP